MGACLCVHCGQGSPGTQQACPSLQSSTEKGHLLLKVNVEVNLGKQFSKHFLQVSSLTPFGILLFVCFVSFVDW